MEKPSEWEPWWDDDQIVLRAGMIKLILHSTAFAMATAFFLVLAFTAFRSGQWGYAISGAIITPLFALMTLRAVRFVTFRPLLEVRSTKLVHRFPRQWISGALAQLPRRMDLRDVVSVRAGQLTRGGEDSGLGIIFETVLDDVLVEFVMETTYLRYPRQNIAALLTYRIARAKGENTVPSEFS